MVKEDIRDLSSVAGPEVFKFIDERVPRVLTAQEHKLIGSTPEFDPETYDPFKPQSFFDGSVPIEETLQLRREQGYIVSHSASGYFGFKGEGILRYAVVIKLSEIDPISGEAVDRQPKLVGLYDEINHSVITDSVILEKHQITKAGRQKLLFKKRHSSV